MGPSTSMASGHSWGGPGEGVRGRVGEARRREVGREARRGG